MTSEGCTPCLRVKRILAELRAGMPDLTVDEIDFRSAAGSKLAIDNGILYPPAVFLDGKLIGKGKIHAETLIAAIRQGNGDQK